MSVNSPNNCYTRDYKIHGNSCLHLETIIQVNRAKKHRCGYFHTYKGPHTQISLKGQMSADINDTTGTTGHIITYTCFYRWLNEAFDGTLSGFCVFQPDLHQVTREHVGIQLFPAHLVSVPVRNCNLESFLFYVMVIFGSFCFLALQMHGFMCLSEFDPPLELEQIYLKSLFSQFLED